MECDGCDSRIKARPPFLLYIYEAPILADALGARVLSALIECEIVDKVDVDTYTFKTPMKRPKTAIKTVHAKLLERRALATAEDKAVQAVLQRFGGDRIPLFKDVV